jgi:hypothetical protein
MNRLIPIRSGNRRTGGPADRRPPVSLNASPDWTTTPPTEPGWYWAIQVDSTTAQMVELTSAGAFRVGAEAAMHKAADFTRWLGPLAIRVPHPDYEAIPARAVRAD